MRNKDQVIIDKDKYEEDMLELERFRLKYDSDLSDERERLKASISKIDNEAEDILENLQKEGLVSVGVDYRYHSSFQCSKRYTFINMEDKYTELTKKSEKLDRMNLWDRIFYK